MAYYYSSGKDKFGPLSFQQLIEADITATSLVWKDGLENWVQAKDLEELSEYFSTLPPPLPFELVEKSRKIQNAATITTIKKTIFSKKLWRRYLACSIIVSVIVVLGSFLPEDSNFPIFKANWENEHPLLSAFRWVFFTFFLLAGVTFLIGLIQGLINSPLGGNNNAVKSENDQSSNLNWEALTALLLLLIIIGLVIYIRVATKG